LATKNAPAKKEKKTSEVAPAQDWGPFKGAGFEGQTSDDLTIPFLSIVQGQSKVLTEGTIEGVSVGDLYNTVSLEVYERPVIVVPCCTEHVFTEQEPDGKRTGPLVAIHKPGDPIVEQAKTAFDRNRAKATEEKEKRYGNFKTAAGNDLVEKFVIYALKLPSVDAESHEEMVAITFRGYGIRYYKRLNTQLNQRAGDPPMFSNRVAVSSFLDSNRHNEKFQSYDLKPAVGGNWEKSSLPLPSGDEIHPLILEGFKVSELMKKGKVHGAHDSDLGEAVDAKWTAGDGGEEDGGPDDLPF